MVDNPNIFDAYIIHYNQLYSIKMNFFERLMKFVIFKVISFPV